MCAPHLLPPWIRPIIHTFDEIKQNYNNKMRLFYSVLKYVQECFWCTFGIHLLVQYTILSKQRLCGAVLV